MTYTQFKLTNGDELVAQVISEPVDDDDTNIVVKNAMMIVRAEDNAEGYRYYSLRPWMAFQLNPEYFQLLNYAHIIGEAKPDKTLIVQYQKSIEAEFGEPIEEVDPIEEMKAIKKLFSKDDDHPSDDGKVVSLFDKDKLH